MQAGYQALGSGVIYAGNKTFQHLGKAQPIRSGAGRDCSRLCFEDELFAILTLSGQLLLVWSRPPHMVWIGKNARLLVWSKLPREQQTEAIPVRY